MSRFPEALALAALIAAAGPPPPASSVSAVQPPTPEIAAWDIDVRPDGIGLPQG